MERQEIKDRVVKVVARVLKTDPAQVREEHAFVADLGAESVQSIELMAGFEEEFDIEMDEDEALAVPTVGHAIDFIAKYLD